MRYNKSHYSIQYSLSYKTPPKKCLIRGMASQYKTSEQEFDFKVFVHR